MFDLHATALCCGGLWEDDAVHFGIWFDIDDGADLSHYEVGVRAAELGALSGGSLPIEALYVRLMQLLAETPEGETVKSLE